MTMFIPIHYRNPEASKSHGSRLFVLTALASCLIAAKISFSAPQTSPAPEASTYPEFLAALEKIVSNDPEYKAQESSIRAEEEQLRALRGAVLPELNLSLSQNKQPTATQGHWDRSLRLETQVNLYRFGQDKARWNEAEAREAQFEQERLNKRVEAENRASQFLQEFWVSAQELETTRKIRELRQRLLDVGERQYQRGLLSLQEKQKIQLDRQSIELDFAEAERRLASARLALESSAPGASWPSAWPWLGQDLRLSLDAPSLKNQNAREALVQLHPRFRAASASLLAANAKTRQLWAAQAPSLDLNIATQRPLSDAAIEWQDRSGQPQSTMTLALTVPILQGLGPSSAYRSQQANTNAEELRLEKLRRDLGLELERQQASLRISWQSLQQRKRIVASARELYEAGLRRFEQGLLSVNELSNDESRLYDYERDLNQALNQFHSSLVGYCQAYGWTLAPCLDRIQK